MTATTVDTFPAQRTKPLLRGVSHEIAAFLFAPAALALVATSRGASAVAGAAVYGLSVFGLFLVSAVYHRPMWTPKAKLLMQRIDHSAIFVLIAGTYTPFCLSTLSRKHPGWGWTLFGLAWGLAALGITFKGVFYTRLAHEAFRPAPLDHLHSLTGRPELKPAFVRRMGWISTLIYLLMGWIIVVPILAGLFAGLPIGRILSPHGFYWLFGGGLFYSLGAAVYSLERLPLHHALWHLFVVGGSACHVFAVLFHVLPGK